MKGVDYNRSVGGDDGENDFILESDDSRVKKLYVAKASMGDTEVISGLGVEFFNGEDDETQSMQASQVEYTFEEGEYITSMNVYAGRWVDRIEFDTSTGGHFCFGGPGGTKYPQDVCSGYLVGFKGYEGDAIDSLRVGFEYEI